MMRKFNNKGMTLLETMLVITISMAVMAMAVYWYGILQKNIFAASTANDINQIIAGIDKRIFLDGYDANKWGDLNYSNTNEVRKFFNEKLISKNSTCGNSNGWEPVTDRISGTTEAAKMEKAALVPCNLWSQKTPWNTELSLTINTNDGKVDTINLYLESKDDKSFEDNFNYMQKAIRDMKAKDKQEISGLHYYGFVSRNDKETIISSLKCAEIKSECLMKASFSAEAGASEYVRVDGKNSMVNSALTFKPNQESPAINCTRWVADSSGNYTSTSVKCGVGIYDTSSNEEDKRVDVVINSVTTKGLYLNKSCNKYIFNFNTQTIESDGVSPCGIYEQDGSVIQMTDKLYTGNLSARKIHARDLFVSNLDVREALTIQNSLTATGNVSVDGNTIVNQDLNVNRNAKFNQNLEVADTLNVLEDTTVTALAAENIYSAKNIESNTFRGNFLDLNYNKAQINKTCKEEDAGKLATVIVNNSQQVLENTLIICKSSSAATKDYKWRPITGTEGQITAFTSECPVGWEKFSKADGRFLMGSGSYNEKGINYNYKVGDTGGEAMHVLTVGELPSHSHESPVVTSGCGSGCQSNAGLQRNNSDTVWSSRSSIQTSSTGGNQAHENRPPYLVVNWCIYTAK